MCPGALGTKATDWKTVLFYAGAGTVSAHRTFTCLRNHQVPAGKTTSREPLAKSFLAAT